MGSRNPVRFLAPLALAAALVGVIVVVQSSQSGSNDARQTTTVSAPVRGEGRRRARKRFYVIKSGDSLSVISERTGVDVADIQSLNPDLDAQTLRVGQRLRLAP